MPVFRGEARKYSATFFSELLTNQFSAWPYFLSKCNRPDFRQAVGELASRKRFDLIFCDFLQTAAPLRQLITRPKVVFQHNVEFSLRKHKWETEEQPFRPLIYAAKCKRTRAVD